MHIINFEYDGLLLSDFGYTVCTFNDQDLETIEVGGDLEFNTVSTFNGKKHELVSVDYPDYLSTTLQICRDVCQSGGDLVMTPEDFRELMCWLQRVGYHDFTPCDVDGTLEPYHYEGSFTSVKRLESDGNIVGAELTFITNRPFAIGDDVGISFTVSSGGTYDIECESDEEGYVYPLVRIVTNQAGNLTINNSLDENWQVYIGNCSVEEVITMEYPVVSSSLNAHLVQNDFNWNFFRLVSTYAEKMNTFTFSLSCAVTLSYSPLIKIGL